MFIRIQDSNDNPPIFSQPAYDVSVSEDAPVDLELLRLRASDADERARLSFSIYGSVDPASMRLFRVNPGTGVVYTADRLDYEARTQHILTIMVRGRGRNACCRLCISKSTSVINGVVIKWPSKSKDIKLKVLKVECLLAVQLFISRTLSLKAKLKKYLLYALTSTKYFPLNLVTETTSSVHTLTTSTVTSQMHCFPTKH